MSVEVKFWPEVRDDFRALPPTVQFMAKKHLQRLERQPKFGLALKEHPIWGDLSDCRKIYLDESHETDPRWRIVYKLLPDEENPEIADVMIIGPRDDDAVYTEVMGRLGRPLGPEHPSNRSDAS